MEEAKVVKEIIMKKDKEQTTYTYEEALALILDCGLSKMDYQTLRDGAKEKGLNLYPAYNFVRTEKENCIPASGIHAEDYSAEVDLQSLLDHTAERCFRCRVKVNLEPGQKLELISKFGFDGSTGQSVYKQPTLEGIDRLDYAIEESLFMTCMVPLQLRIVETGEILWNNEKPSSTLYCRPIRFRYTKETKEIILEEERFLTSKDFQPTMLGENQCFHKVELTMIDGKVATVLSDKTSSTQCCSICGCSPKQMNDLEVVKTLSDQVENDNFNHGLSTLHAWIRCMEFCLHLSYRLEIKSWQVKAVNKEVVQIRKDKLRRVIRERLGLTVDVPSSGGSGTTNDGNCARRFFRDHKIVAEILEIKEELIKNLYVILCVLSSTEEIDADKLEQFCLNTLKIHIENYSWFCLPQAVHKILVHGHQVVKAKCLPLGMLSEEAQEAQNKHFKNFREKFTRKISREKTNMDMMRRLLCHSDPVISSLRRSEGKKKLMELPEESKYLLL